MRDFFEEFTEFCKTPGVDSNKAKSYAKAIEYLCDYLGISEINAQSFDRIREVEETITDRNSSFYKDLLKFLTDRGQKSYLENGFIKAALKPFFKFKQGFPNIKELFRKWFGMQPQKNDSSVNYSDSTIDAAVRLLESGMPKLGVPKYEHLNCFDITDHSEFEVIRDECYSSAEVFDKKQFHGDFRNGLDFYLLFLKELAQFKELVEIFVRQLKINNDILEGEKIYGQGYRDMPKIQGIYKHCREFDGYILELNLQAGYNAYNSSNYINLRETWINVVPVFKEVNGGKHDVDALQVVIKPDNKVISNYPAISIDKLGLFDNQSPNEAFASFFVDFRNEIYKYLKIKPGHYDSWEIVDEVTAIKTCDKSFFDYNGSGVPKGICWFFDAEDIEPGENKAITLIYNGTEYNGKLTNDTTDRRRIQIRWYNDLGNCLGEYKDAEIKAKFTKNADSVYEITIIGGEKEMTVKEKINAIKEYIAAKGFNYEGNLIENFYLSLKSKPFVILAGTSGTGKTRLVKLFAEAIGAKMKLVPVRPDWSDSSDLFGHTDLSGNFQPGAIIDFIKQAEWNNDTPYFLCLDEMNLARVEYYLSDFLSVIETRDRKANGEIETDPLVDVDYYKDSDAKAKYGRVFIPENLYIVGTVNMDETTFPFSKKVLDRANTIEFSYVNLMYMVGDKKETVAQKIDNSFLKTDYLYLRDCEDAELIEGVCFDLEELNQILVKANLHVGYRVRDEISFYLMNNKKADLLSVEAALDNEIMQKILPRVQGSSAAIKDVLSELFIKCAGDYTGFSGISAYEQMESYIESKECKYPNSAKKIKFMMRRYEEDGFTSYWI